MGVLARFVRVCAKTGAAPHLRQLRAYKMDSGALVFCDACCCDAWRTTGGGGCRLSLIARRLLNPVANAAEFAQVHPHHKRLAHQQFVFHKAPVATVVAVVAVVA